MMCDKCGAKSADVELYCKNCGSDLQIFGAGAGKVKLTSDTKEEAAAGTSVTPSAGAPLGPPPSGTFPLLPGAGSFPLPGSAPGLSPNLTAPPGPSPASPPASFGNLPGFPLPAPSPQEQTPPPPLSPPMDSTTDAADMPSFISRTPTPSTQSSKEKPFTAHPPEDQGSGPVDFSFLEKRAEQKPEAPSEAPPEASKEEKENPLPPPASLPPSPGTFSSDFFKPKEDK